MNNTGQFWDQVCNVGAVSVVGPPFLVSLDQGKNQLACHLSEPNNLSILHDMTKNKDQKAFKTENKKVQFRVSKDFLMSILKAIFHKDIVKTQ